jgi:tetratricopeptide (TPR) repeat protein
MDSWRGRLLLTLVVLLAAGGTYTAQRRLDRRRPQTGYQELMYLPKGWALKLVALGFDAPLADTLYIKGLIYWSENARAQAKRDREASFKYVYEIFDAATDLSPRFKAAYINGGMLISATGRTEPSKRLFEKGLEVFPRDWEFYLQLGSLAMIQMQDRQLAREYFEQALACPDVPAHIAATWAGLSLETWEEQGIGREDRYSLEIAKWRSVLEGESAAPEVRRYARRRLALVRTWRLEYRLTQALEAYLADHGRDALAAMLREGRSPLPVLIGEYLPPAAAEEAGEFPYYEEGDELRFFLEGRVRSLQSATLEVQRTWILVSNRRSTYERRHDRPPESLAALHDAGLLSAVPEHPLRGEQYRFALTPRGPVLERDPHGPRYHYELDDEGDLQSVPPLPPLPE